MVSLFQVGAFTRPPADHVVIEQHG